MSAATAIPISLARTIATSYGVSLGEATPVEAGDEAITWRVEGQPPLLIHQSPRWRSVAELGWVHALVARVATHIPEAIPPLRNRDGHTFVEHEGTLVTMYPYIAGTHLDRDNPSHRDAAAAFLARLHGVLLTLATPPRPAPDPESPWAAVLRDPRELADPALDEWHASLEQLAGLQRGLVHGDYYRRNLLWANGRIVAVVDWHEAHTDLLLAEVANAAWQFGKDPSGRDLATDRARSFLDRYADAGGVAEVTQRDLVLPLIRWRLREEVRLSDVLSARGFLVDEPYREALIVAFSSLRDRSL